MKRIDIEKLELGDQGVDLHFDTIYTDQKAFVPFATICPISGVYMSPLSDDLLKVMVYYHPNQLN